MESDGASVGLRESGTLAPEPQGECFGPATSFRDCSN